MNAMTRHRLGILLVISIACVTISGAIGSHVYPWGVPYRDLYAFYYASTDTSCSSPSGRTIRYVLNDAGASHSGLHCVWILIKRSQWHPWSVAVSGWSEAIPANDAIRWIGLNEFEVKLSNARRGGQIVCHRVVLP